MESNNPWSDAPSQNASTGSRPNQESAQSYHRVDPSRLQSQPQSSSPQPQQQQQQWQQQPAPSQGIGRSETEQIFAQQEDRAAQVEHMQQYEATAQQSEGDRIQAHLQKEFPNIDSSLIAAIYNERPGNLPEVRELLQELNSS